MFFNESNTHVVLDSSVKLLGSSFSGVPRRERAASSVRLNSRLFASVYNDRCVATNSPRAATLCSGRYASPSFSSSVDVEVRARFLKLSIPKPALYRFGEYQLFGHVTES